MRGVLYVVYEVQYEWGYEVQYAVRGKGGRNQASASSSGTQKANDKETKLKLGARVDDGVSQAWDCC